MDERELKEAKQVAKALKEGANLPGGCKNKKTANHTVKTPTIYRNVSLLPKRPVL